MSRRGGAHARAVCVWERGRHGRRRLELKDAGADVERVEHELAARRVAPERDGAVGAGGEHVAGQGARGEGGARLELHGRDGAAVARHRLHARRGPVRLEDVPDLRRAGGDGVPARAPPPPCDGVARREAAGIGGAAP